MIALRDYQMSIIHQARALMLRRTRRILLQAPTGSGKTALASFMAGESARRAAPAWFICHRAELVEQTSYTFRKFDIPHSFIAAGRPYDPRALVHICSIDTLKGRAALLPPPRLLIWDECHHMSAAGWALVQSLFAESFHIGLSATPCRLDGKGLDAHFDEMIMGPSVAWLIEGGFLSRYRVYAPSAPDLSGVRTERGDYARGDSAEAMDKPKLTGDMIQHWRRHAQGLRTVGFGVTIAHSQHLAAQFCAAGIRAAHLDGGTHKAERREIVQRFAAGAIDVLFNVDLFGEGFDLAAIAQRDVSIDAVIQGRPTQSLALNRQQQGRALRPGDGKVAIILDHAGNTARHGLPDDEIEWTLEGRKRGRRADNDNGPPPPVTCPGCFGQIRRPAPVLCPYCGQPMVRREKTLEVADGDLVLVTREQRQAMRAAEDERKRLEREQRRREESDCTTLAQWVALAQRRGYPQPQRWAFVQWSRKHNRQKQPDPAAA